MGFGGVVFSFPSQQSRDYWVSEDPYRKACAWGRHARHVETVLRHAWKARHASEGVIK